MTHHHKPLFVGMIMGPLMLWMMHDFLMGSGDLSGAAIVFVLAHLVVFALIAGAAVFASRLSNHAKTLLARLHRPRLGHALAMIAGAALSAGLVHFSMHGLA